jgi:hypothetical protein
MRIFKMLLLGFALGECQRLRGVRPPASCLCKLQQLQLINQLEVQQLQLINQLEVAVYLALHSHLRLYDTPLAPAVLLVFRATLRRQEGGEPGQNGL